MSLRVRLLVGLVSLAAAGLLVVGVVTYAEQRSFLLKRVDQEVTAALTSVSRALDNAGVNVSSTPSNGAPSGSFQSGPRTLFGQSGATSGAGGGGGPPPVSARSGAGPQDGGVPGPPVSLPPGTYAERRDANGHTVGHITFTYGQRLAVPKLPTSIPVTAGGHQQLITIGSVGSSGLQYRVIAVPTGDQPGTTVIAIPLRDVNQTLQQLLQVELLVGGAVLLALAALGWWVIGIGLRPLERMGKTADAIAAGDLTQRVTPATTRTEVGRLGLALNAMLGQIEKAFGESRASEGRLRRFIADASHELRTPLSSIRGYAELYRIGAAREPADTEKAMSRIEDEAVRMGTLVEDLLTLARLDELPEAELEPVDLRKLARDVADDARAVAPDRTIAVHENGPATAVGNRHQLHQVVANLMRNALVHTPPGTPIELRVQASDGQAVLEVRDHGPGLPAEAGEAIFERFWRADPGRERGAAGAGLGLAIVAAIVSAHGGHADAHNAPDGGAAFVITLPATREAPAAPA